MAKQRSAPAKASSAGPRPEAAARKKVRSLWKTGDLVHFTYRYPRRRNAPRIDRLAGILRGGLIAPACCPDGSVRSDLSIVLDGASIGYDALVFLHRFGEQSYIYTLREPGRFAVFVDPKLAVVTQEDMGESWLVLCQDEVYVRDRIAVDRLLGIAVCPEDGEAVLGEFVDEFRRLALPLYDYDGKLLWPPKG